MSSAKVPIRRGEPPELARKLSTFLAWRWPPSAGFDWSGSRGTRPRVRAACSPSPDAISDEVALKVDERDEHVEEQAAAGCAGVDALRTG